MGKIRLFIDHPLAAGQPVPLTDGQAHYLSSVMRQGAGNEIAVFNGRQGEWRARIAALGRKGGNFGNPGADLWADYVIKLKAGKLRSRAAHDRAQTAAPSPCSTKRSSASRG